MTCSLVEPATASTTSSYGAPMRGGRIARLAAELQVPADQPAALGADDPAGRRRPGEGDLVDQRVRDQGRARVTVSQDDVEHARRQPGFERGVAHDVGVQGGLGRRLEHDRAARRERRRDLHHREDLGVVPRGDGPDHADRLAADDRGAGGAGTDLFQGHRLDQLGVHLEQARRGEAVEGRRQPDRHAVFLGDQLAGALGPRAEGGGELVHVVGALGGRRLAPRTVVQGPAGGLDGPVDVGVGAQGRDAERLFGSGLEGAVRTGAQRVDPLAVDEEPRTVQFGSGIGGYGHGTPKAEVDWWPSRVTGT